MLLHLQNNPENTGSINKKQALIDEQTSPLQRMMWLYNVDDPQKRTFENNICTFHIGNGYFLSVAHNLRLQAGYFRSIDEETYKKELLPILDGSQTRFLDEHYFKDEYTGKRYLKSTDAASLQKIADILKQKRFDTRWVALAQKGICKPYLLCQFRNNAFYNDMGLTAQFNPNMQLFENSIRKYTFMIGMQLVNAFYDADIALYKAVNVSPEIINKIPAVELDFQFLDDERDKLYCLQSSPTTEVGRMLNVAKIEGMLDHFNVMGDDIGGNYLFEGYRYLIKGYFRFGSSGAPYLFYDDARGKYVVNAIQSEASGIQLSIDHKKDGNMQYINAIASPLYIVKDALKGYLSKTTP